MKKLLLTIASVCALGIGYAQTYPAPVMGFRNANNEPITEVIMNPGDSLEITVCIESMSANIVSGMQVQWGVFDFNHNPIAAWDENKVTLASDYYNSRWFEAIEAGSSDESVGGFPGNVCAIAISNDYYYRIIFTNPWYNMCFFRWADENQTIEKCPQNIGHFTLVASPDWQEEVATMELDLDYSKWSQCLDDNFSGMESVFNTTPMILTIKNGALDTPLPELPGYIIVGSPAANGQFNVNYMPGDYEGEYEIIVTINGEEVEPIAEGTYKAREGENNVVVTVKADGYNDKVATNNFYFHYPASPTYVVTYDDDFMYITFSCEEGELTIYDEYGQEVAENPVKIARPEYDEGAAPVYVHYSAKATKDGVDSEIIHVTEMVNQKDNTGSVNELNSNKQVISVRYFNMVGQEMRQANGLTIVVSSYNDGTTNAVKMIK